MSREALCGVKLMGPSVDQGYRACGSAAALGVAAVLTLLACGVGSAAEEGEQAAPEAQFARIAPTDGSASESASKLPEVTVTAQKREQSIQDVGIAITAYSGEQLHQLGFQDSFDIARMTPGVHISGNNGGQKTLFSIRGVTQNDFNDQTESPVAVYVDEGYVAFGQGQTFGMFDLDRVEVLKGPQGTLFGRNATGGLVQFITRKPSQNPSGFADLTYGSYDQVRFEGAVNGPLTPTISARASVMYNRFDSIIKNDYPNRFATLDQHPSPIGGQDTFNDDTLGLRTQVLLVPASEVSVLLAGNYSRSRLSTSPLMELPTIPIFDAAGNHVNTIVAGPADTREAIGPGGITINHPLSFDADLLRPAGGNLYGPSCTPQNYKDLTCSMDFAFSKLNTADSWGASAKLEWKFPAFTLTALTDYKDFDKFQALPADGGPASTVNVLFGAEAQQFSQEVRLNGEADRLRWVSGLYYLHVNVNSKVSLDAEADSLFLPLVGVPWEDTAISHLDTDSSSIFGQLEFDLTRSLTLISGVRAIKEKKKFTGEETFFLNTDPFTIDTAVELFPVQPRTFHAQDDTLWSGKLQLDWHASDDLLIFGGVNRGVKAGGFNATTTFGGGFPATDIPYGEEVLRAYETGFKWDNLFAGTTRINGSVYYYDYKDYQGFFFTQITGYVRNVDAKYKGFEVEVLSAPVTGLTVGLSAAYLDAKVYGVQIGPGILVNTEPAFSPDRKVTALVRKTWPRPLFGGAVTTQLDYSYVASFWDNIRNFDASRLPSYSLADVRIEWRSQDERWQASAFVNNIADKRYFTIGYDLSNATGSNSLVPGKPRWFGASLKYSFGK